MSAPNRNDSCPCGSGRKYKQCCLKRDEALAASKRAEATALPEILQEALVHHQSGRLSQAEAIYRQILQIEPSHPDALHFLGLIAHQVGKNEIAAELMGKALFIKPDSAEAHNNLGLVFKDQAKLDEALKSYCKALSIKPDFAEAHSNLGNALRAQGRLDEAAKSLRRALSLKPGWADAYSNLGAVLQEQGKLDEAVEYLHAALSIRPDFADAHSNMGNVLCLQGKLDDAVDHYRKALSLNPDWALAHSNLGIALKDQGKLDEAFEHYHKALMLKPDFAEAHSHLGVALKEQGRLDEAIECFHRSLSLKPDWADTYGNLGAALQDQGKLEEAAEHYRKALSIKPNFSNWHSNLLFALNFQSGLSKEDVFRASQEYEARIGIPLRPGWRVHSNDKKTNRRLRVGYVSPDFRRHAVAIFAEPILAHHDKSQVEIFCYAEVMREDEVTVCFRQLADHWYSTVGLSDDAVAEMIRDHRIDILVDLAGHTANNRLPVFARKPAPVQITYLGYPGTTGLSAMDYRITDRHADPVGVADAFYTERLLRLPDSLCCYRPRADMPASSPLPALARGYLTFGSFNNFNKIDQPTLDLWAELLRALPTARLMMLTVPEGEARQQMLRRFGDLGIDAQRLELHGKLSAAEFHRKFLEVDLSLDPVTVSGGTTTCESLWMGVPVMALVGERFITRVSNSFLNTAGLADFAAVSREDYIRIATHLADNLPLLAEIRAGLRDHLGTTPLIDEVGFTRNLENLYREIWEKWCSAN